MGAHLYDKVKMLYEEGYEPKPVLTQEMEDAIFIVSNLSSPCLQHEFYYPPTDCPITNMAFLPDYSFSEHEGPLPLEWEGNVGKGGECSNPICASLLAISE